ncbi:MAG: PstS family phosphate ABC transporter substrate-binding protein [Saprospiraceae bacterium]|nr:PstS family phosphate ABC transporter substrate-binding protein [Saprospiraceae bacterium]
MKIIQYFVLLLSMISYGACNPGTTLEKSNLKGHIRVDGSSTVYVITEAIAEEYRAFTPGVKITIGISGTGGGFNKFGRKEIDIADASRNIKEKEQKNLSMAGLTILEIPIAYDGLAVVTNKANTWTNYLTSQELKELWRPEAEKKLTKWSQLRAGFPEKDIVLMGPGTASGTFDYFTEAVVGRSGSSRGDFMPSEDDNVLVQGIKGNPYGLAFFGLSFATENQNELKILSIDDGQGPVYPNKETIRNKTYLPLTRKLFIYVTNESVQKPEVVDFLRFYLRQVKEIAEEVGYIPLNDEDYDASIQELNRFVEAHVKKQMNPNNKNEQGN